MAPRSKTAKGSARGGGRRRAADTGKPRARAAGNAYFAARRDAQEFAGFHPSQGSADSDAFGERMPIAHGARDFERNDGMISGAIQGHKDRVIGPGLTLQAMPDYRILGITREAAQDQARRMEDIFREWSENPEFCDVTGILTFGDKTRQSTGSDVVNGESLDIVHWLPERQAQRGSRFATVLQSVEPDVMATPPVTGGADIRDGVEVDEFGAPVAYHIGTHPGDAMNSWTWMQPAAATNFARFERIEKRNAAGRLQIIHNFDQKRPSQHRGVSLLAPVMSAILMRSRYQRAELQAAVVNAVIAAVLETPLDGASMAELFESADKYQEKRAGAHGVRFGLGPGGHIPRLFMGEKLSGFNGGRPNAAFENFVTGIDRYIAKGLGQTYESYVGDFSKTNYSSARASLLETFRFVLWHRMFKTTYYVRPVYGLIMEEAVARGYIDLRGFLSSPVARRAWLKSSWMGPGRGWVDPVKEIQAAMFRISSGLSSLRDEAAEQGKDWEELLEQIKTEREKLTELGISFPDVSLVGVADPNAPDPEDAQNQQQAGAA